MGGEDSEQAHLPWVQSPPIASNVQATVTTKVTILVVCDWAVGEGLRSDLGLGQTED